MNLNLLQQQIAVSFLQGIGPIRARQLLSKLPDISCLFTYSIKQLVDSTGISRKLLLQMDRELALAKAEKEVDFIQRNKIQTYFFTEKDYPRRLKQCEDAPIILYGKGQMNFNTPMTVAVVGTRKATEYGKQTCEELIRSFVGKDITVVSGLAYGIDICVHQLCLKHNIPTIGVLGHGLDRLYPQAHKNAAKRMLDNGGLLTEFLPGTLPDRENFPMRNRIVAGMCDATIVIESKNKGGSLITAELANDYSRDVFAVPGNIGQQFSVGCNQLISQSKAHLFLSPDHFLKWMSWDSDKKVAPAQRELFQDLNQEERVVVDILEKDGEQHMDALAIKSKNPISKTSVLLFQLEMNGWVKALPGQKYALLN